MLLRLIGTYFDEKSLEVASLLQVQNMSVEELRSDKTRRTSLKDPRLWTFYELLPRPLDKEEEVVLDVISGQFKHIGRMSLKFLLERFSGNNHVISDERLKPIGHAIL